MKGFQEHTPEQYALENFLYDFQQKTEKNMEETANFNSLVSRDFEDPNSALLEKKLILTPPEDMPCLYLGLNSKGPKNKKNAEELQSIDYSRSKKLSKEEKSFQAWAVTTLFFKNTFDRNPKKDLSDYDLPEGYSIFINPDQTSASFFIKNLLDSLETSEYKVPFWEIRIKNCHIDSNAINKEFGNLLKLAPILSLDLEGANIGDEGSSVLFKALQKKGGMLKKLNLNDNNIEKIKEEDFLPFMKQNSSLKELRLDENPIELSAVNLLVKGSIENKALEILSLYGVAMNPEQIFSFPPGIKVFGLSPYSDEGYLRDSFAKTALSFAMSLLVLYRVLEKLEELDGEKINNHKFVAYDPFEEYEFFVNEKSIQDGKLRILGQKREVDDSCNKFDDSCNIFDDSCNIF